MSRRGLVLLASLTTSVLVLSIAAYFYKTHQDFLAQRHHLLCDVLRPGMSRDQVLHVLQQEGDFTMREADWPGGFFALDIQFTNPKVLHKYGYFSVVFIDYKYTRAIIPRGSDSPEFICDFYQAIESITQTP